MASTNKTPYYGLNQWAASDPVLREDFNADNAKIDAAIKSAASVVKLKEVTTTAAAQQVEFDLSDIDLDRYQELKFCMELLPESKISYAEVICGYFNEVNAFGPNNRMESVKAIGSSSTMLYLHGQFSQTTYTLFPSFWTIRTSVSDEQSSLTEDMGRYSLVGESYCVMRGSSGIVAVVADNSCQFHVVVSSLNKLILAVQNEGGTQQKIAAGSKLKVYGVLR